MAVSNERNLNITLKNEEKDQDEVVISISAILKKLKKYFTIWLVAAVFLFVASFGFATLTTHVKKPELTALVSFSYSGIEKGKDPAGRKFDINSIKNPNVIERALTDLDLSLEHVEDIRRGIKFKGIIPKDAMDRITVYKSVYETASSGNLQAAEEMLDVTYYPTQYEVYFDYNETELSSSQALDVFNTMLEEYQNYFYETYGYNESLGSAVKAIDYTEYDYPEALDVLSNSLSTLKKYVRTLDSEDATRFRSSETGYTFDDIYQAIKTLQSVDVDRISSYIALNNVTKDKGEAIAYCEYRLKALAREKTQLEEQVKVFDDSIKQYEKDQVVIIGNQDVNVDSTITQASAQYDKMINQKNNAATDLADTKRSITYYSERKDALNGNKTATDAQKAEVDSRLSKLNDKVNELVDIVSKTADDYYQNVTFKNAYNILVPASDSVVGRLGRIIDNAKLLLILLEGLAVMIYFAVAFIEAIVGETRKRKGLVEGTSGSEDDTDEESDDLAEAIEEIADEIEEEADVKKTDNKNKKKK